MTGGGAIMSLTKLETVSVLFMGVGSAVIIVGAYLVSRLCYGTNGLLICFDLCCADRVAITRKPNS